MRIAGAPLLPSLNADASGAREILTTPQAALFNNFTAQLTASYELDFWGKNRAARAAAVAPPMPAVTTARPSQLSVMASVRQHILHGA